MDNDHNIQMNTSRPKTQNTVVLLWRSLGPYHVARAEAAGALLTEHGLQTIAVELCDGEETRDWRIDRRPVSFQTHTLAPGVKLSPQTPSVTPRLIEFLNETHPALVAVAGYDRPEMRAALRWARRHNAVAVLMSETKYDDRPRPWWRTKLAALLVRQAQAALVSGSASAEYLVTLGMPREKIFRQYGAVDNDFFRARAEAVARDFDRFDAASDRCFVACSRLIEERKNLLGLLEAYRRYRLQMEHDAWRLVVCGDGPDRNLLEAAIRDRAIDGVELVGFQQPEPLAEIYARAACFIHPAVNEAWGLVVNEAMAAGLPVLVSRRCGCAVDLVVEGENGFCFNPHDADELASLMRFISHAAPETLRSMGAASERLIRPWGPESFAAGLLRAAHAADGQRFALPFPAALKSPVEPPHADVHAH